MAADIETAQERKRRLMRERGKRWRERNLEKAREATRKSVRNWRAKNPEQSRALCRAHHAKNAEAIREQKREYYQRVRKQADKTEAGLLADRNRKARRRSLTKQGNVTKEEWDAILEKHGHACAYCRQPSQNLEMDHVIALSKGGPHCASNIVPACKPCNSKKGAR